MADSNSRTGGPGSGRAAAALMDSIYRRQRHIYNATRKYFLLGRDHLIDGLQPAPGQTVLELGCGTGRNLIAAARRHPRARFYGIDVSAEMMKTARGTLAATGLDRRITLAEGDATAVDPAALFGVARFDRVFFSYSLSMIPPWQAALAHAAVLLAPGGRLSVVDFGDQAGLPGWFGPMLRDFLAHYHVAPRHDLPAALTALPGTAAVHPLYRGYAVYGTLSSAGP